MKTGNIQNPLKNFVIKYKHSLYKNFLISEKKINSPGKNIISGENIFSKLFTDNSTEEEKKFLNSIIYICNSVFSYEFEIKDRLLEKAKKKILAINNFEIAITETGMDFYRQLEDKFKMKFIINLLKEIAEQSEVAIYREIINRELEAIERWREPEIGYLALKEILDLENLCTRLN